MAKLTSAALSAHELGLAATFGALLFGETGLGKAVKVLPDEKDRSRVIDEAWRTYSVPKTIGLITTAATWLIGRSVFGGQFFGRKMRNLIPGQRRCLGRDCPFRPRCTGLRPSALTGAAVPGGHRRASVRGHAGPSSIPDPDRG